MPHFASHTIYLCDWTGNPVSTLFPGNDFLRFDWQHILNGPGVYSIQLVAETDTKDLFVKHYGIKDMRNYGAGAYEEYYGFHLNKREWMVNENVDEHYWMSIGQSPEWLLDQPMLQPARDTTTSPAIMYEKWWSFGTADDVMKLMVTESMGGSAYITRQFSNFTVEGNASLGNYDCYEGRYPRLLEGVQALSDERGATDFRVVHVAGGFEFRTYSPYYGRDLRRGNTVGNRPTVFSLGLGNVLNPVVEVASSEQVTALYCGWDGQGAEQSIYPLGNFSGYTDPVGLAESPYSRREAYCDVRDVSSAASIPAIAAQVLSDEGQQVRVAFDLLQTDGCLYGDHWKLGDLVTLDLWGETYDMRIVEAAGSLNKDDEERIIGTAELWTREI